MDQHDAAAALIDILNLSDRHDLFSSYTMHSAEGDPITCNGTAWDAMADLLAEVDTAIGEALPELELHGYGVAFRAIAEAMREGIGLWDGTYTIDKTDRLAAVEAAERVMAGALDYTGGGSIREAFGLERWGEE